MIRVATKENCQPCRMTKNLLNQRGIPFEEVTGDDAIMLAKSLGYAQLPVVVNGKKSWSGFNVNKLRSIKHGV